MSCDTDIRYMCVCLLRLHTDTIELIWSSIKKALYPYIMTYTYLPTKDT